MALMNIQTLQQRKKMLALTSATGLGLLAVVLILVNLLSNWVPMRWDITAHHAYSLSPASRKLVSHLDDPIIVKAFFTPDLPAPYNSFGRYVKDMLTEYHAASNGKVRYEFELTQPAKNFEDRALQAGLVPIQFEQMGNDQFQIRRGFMGLVLYYRDHTEILPVVKRIEGLEYDLTSRMARMVQKQKKTILLTAGHGESAWRSAPSSKLAPDLAQLYNLEDLPLPQMSTAAFQADALVVVGPKQKFDDASLWALDQAIMRGIPTVFLVDTKNFAMGQFMMSPQETGLKDLLASYGVKLGDQLVYDAQCETVNMTQNVGGFSFTSSLRYPYVPSVTQFDRSQSLVQGLETVAFPFAVALEPLNNGTVFTPLFKSSVQSWLAPKNTYSVAPNHIPQPGPQDPQGPFILGALLHGSFKSYFTGKPIPVPGQTLIGTSPAMDLIVLGTSHQLDPALPDFPGNEALISNIFSYAVHDETLVGIRSKGEIIRPLKPVSSAQKEVVKLLCLLGVPLLVIVWGLARWKQRQNWRQTITAGFAAAPPPAALTA
jgi:gliding-associated putative ABC transporter substrate-binding component GldG